VKEDNSREGEPLQPPGFLHELGWKGTTKSRSHERGKEKKKRANTQRPRTVSSAAFKEEGRKAKRVICSALPHPVLLRRRENSPPAMSEREQ